MNEGWTPIAKHYTPLRAGSIDGTDEEPHDRAVSRAMAANYRPNKGVGGDPHLTLFVARLNPQTTEQKLRDTFSRFGDVRRVRLVRDLVTGFSKCYGFIEYKEERALAKAHRDANKLLVDQHEVFVDFELERFLRGWVPRRFGGGLGGKKESGQLRFGGRDRPFRKPINLPALYAEGPAAKRERSGSGERFKDVWQRDRDRDRQRGRGREREEREEGREKRVGERERYRNKEREHKRHREEDGHRRRQKADPR